MRYPIPAHGLHKKFRIRSLAGIFRPEQKSHKRVLAEILAELFDLGPCFRVKILPALGRIFKHKFLRKAMNLCLEYGKRNSFHNFKSSKNENKTQGAGLTRAVVENNRYVPYRPRIVSQSIALKNASM